MNPIFNFQKKSVLAFSTLDETTRDGINKAYIPKFLYKPPFGYPRNVNIGYIRYLATTPYAEMCISTVIDELASIKWNIVPEKGFEDLAKDEEIDHIRSLFMNPNTNPEDTFEDVFVRMPVRDLLEVNAGILNKIFNLKGELVAIVPRDGGSFTKNPDLHGMMTDRDDIILPDHILRPDEPLMNPYKDITTLHVRERAAYFQYGWMTSPLPVPFGKREIIWIDKMRRTDDHYGYSPVQILAKSLQVLIYCIESDLDYFNDNNVPKGIIGIDQGDAPEIEAFKAQWKESQMKKDEFGNLTKAIHKVPIMNAVPRFERIEFTAQEMQLIEKQKWWTKMVWAMFGVTPTELGYTEDASGQANEIVQSKIFKKKAIYPILRRLENKYTSNIISEFEYFAPKKVGKKTVMVNKYKFKFDVFDIDEEKNLYNLYDTQVKSGIRTINEIRTDLDLEPLEWGDKPPREWQVSETSNNFNMDMGDKEKNANDSEKGAKSLNQKKSSKSFIKEYKAEDGMPVKDSEVQFEKALSGVLKKVEKLVLSKTSDINDNTVIQGIKSFEKKGLKEILNFIKTLFSTENLKEVAGTAIRSNYLDGWDEAEKEIDRNLIPNKAAIDFISSYTFENIKDMTEDLADDLRQVFQRKFMENQSISTLKTKIQKVFKVSDNRAKMIARTESLRAQNVGKLQAYQQSGLEGTKVYVAALDSRTSDLCKRLDGQEVGLYANFVDPKGEWEGLNPPAHPNCRSTFFFKLKD